MLKYNFPPQYECRNRILKVKVIYQHHFECIDRSLNIKMLYSSSVRMSKLDFECQNKIFMANSIVRQNRIFKVKIQYSASVSKSK